MKYNSSFYCYPSRVLKIVTVNTWWPTHGLKIWKYKSRSKWKSLLYSQINDQPQPESGNGGSGGLIAKLCLTLYDPRDCSPPGSSVHGISQARILEWVAISFSRASSQPRDWTRVSCSAGRFFTAGSPGKPKSGNNSRVLNSPWSQ